MWWHRLSWLVELYILISKKYFQNTCGSFLTHLKNQRTYFLLILLTCVCGSILTHLSCVCKFLYLRRIRVNIMCNFHAMHVISLGNYFGRFSSLFEIVNIMCNFHAMHVISLGNYFGRFSSLFEIGIQMDRAF